MTDENPLAMRVLRMGRARIRTWVQGIMSDSFWSFVISAEQRFSLLKGDF
jgi:hypothetical protein